MTMKVPFLDLPLQHHALEDELLSVFRDAIRTAGFIGGPQVQAFEEEFARFCQTRFCVAVNSGTDALRFALIAAGIGPGDEVITVPNTFIATTEAISQTGARPVFVDVDERTSNMDPARLEQYLQSRLKAHGTGPTVKAPTPEPCTLRPAPHSSSPARVDSAQSSVLSPHSSGSDSSSPAPSVSPHHSTIPSFHFSGGARPKAVIPVHLYGQPVDMDAILAVARHYGLLVIEDACQAHGAEYLSNRTAPPSCLEAGSNPQSAIRNPHSPGPAPFACQGEAAPLDSELRTPNFPGPTPSSGSDSSTPCTLHPAPSSWLRAGSIGLAAAFSFYPGKNLGACGEAGAVTTDNEEIANKIRVLRDHGQAKKYFHDVEGYNGRLDAIQAGILRVKLRHLEGWTESRRQRAKRYTELLAGVDGVIAPFEPSWAKAVYHLYVIRTARRDELQKHLADRGISTGLHYPLPLHLQAAYRHMGHGEGDFPVTERLASELLSLPMYPELTSAQQEQVVEAIRAFFESESTKSRVQGAGCRV
jgi:dTDP-4-amino-4,6-dideoxygalactose transaminase